MQALHQLSVYVGYKGPCQLLETLLLSLVRSWKEEGHPLQEFPYDHLGYSSLKDFFKCVNEVGKAGYCTSEALRRCYLNDA